MLMLADMKTSLGSTILPLVAVLILAPLTALMCGGNKTGKDIVGPGDYLASRNTGVFEFPQQRSTALPEHVILFIGDGMQLEHEIAASRYLYGEDGALAWDQFEYQGYVTTWDIDTYNRFAQADGVERYDPASFDPLVGYDPSRGGSAPYPLDTSGQSSYFLTALPAWGTVVGTYAIPATDSASAATAIATGSKTDEGNISWKSGDPASGQLTTIAETMREVRGASIGVVSTVQFSHATPAAFVAHNVNRGNTGEIAHEIITATKPDVVIGGGHPGWSGGYINNSDLAALRNSTDYVLVERKAGQDGGATLLTGATAAVEQHKKLFGLFGGTLGCFDPAVPADSPGAPSFTTTKEDPSLAQATQAALTVLGQNPDGLFLMVEEGDIDWANHYNDYHWMIGAMWKLNEAVAAAVEFVDRPGDDIDWSNTIIMVTADHSNSYMRIADTSMLPKGHLPQMVGTKYHYSYPGGEVTYGTTQHTNEPVIVSARGHGGCLFQAIEGSWYPGTRLIDNTDLYRVMAGVAGVGQQ